MHISEWLPARDRAPYPQGVVHAAAAGARGGLSVRARASLSTPSLPKPRPQHQRAAMARASWLLLVGAVLRRARRCRQSRGGLAATAELGGGGRVGVGRAVDGVVVLVGAHDPRARHAAAAAAERRRAARVQKPGDI